MTTAESIQNADGSWMTPAQIQDILALPTTPTFVANVTSIPPGTTFLMGIVGPNVGFGGGGIQFLETNGFYLTFAKGVPLP